MSVSEPSAWKRRVSPFIGVMVGFGCWMLLTSTLLGASPIVRSFSPVYAVPALVDLLAEERTWTHVATSLQRIAVGLGLACIVGIPAGLALGTIRWLERASEITIQFIRMISPLSWTPIAVMVLGIGNAPVYFLIFIAAVWPLIINTAAGVKACDPRWTEMARSLGATSSEVLRHVVVPAVTKHIVTGFRLALGVGWIVLVPAEMLGVRAGLGYAILDARDRMAYPELMATILLIGLIGWIIDTVARQLEAGTVGKRRVRRPADPLLESDAASSYYPK